ncbi:TRAPP subunit [Lobosporangium transversale]|uniref:Sedlin, N-terminal conserved region-domain-containing protein n=1 Tax=Lobosporangium transversale TaxID=64571 RepID=A0A1Y2GNY3_9FUNG|nr:Sedlin, N-terminal conserved region-domain-containing protein [Lobosporangium transversale]KAF9914455.1 TRAPP subunit [Lobosporangium transversale]ORZ16819.1 Sedlin, N-terminal conserved region-domain-containing protein [Lobosporangium transversale]|eukprot:XP_021881754.1 Sedlin, N-terminal conserved region-domain-containing protein [Lobosporangium transversale]
MNATHSSSSSGGSGIGNPALGYGNTPTCYFVMIGTKDNPIYEAEFVSVTTARSSSGTSGIPEAKKEEFRHLNQFIAHSALDMIEDIQWSTNQMYLKSIDKFNERFISAYLTAGNIKLLLLHDAKSEESIRNFFNDCYELYIKTLLNPFYEPNSIISSPAFDAKVRLSAKRCL